MGYGKFYVGCNITYVVHPYLVLINILRIFVVYRPFQFFVSIGGILFLLGFLLGCRFLTYYLLGEGEGKVQSLILASILIGMGFQMVIVAFVADLLAVNRRLLEEVQYKLREKDFR